MRLVLFLIVWSQVTFAAHQFEHSVDGTGHTCEICLQFERLDDVVPETAGLSPVAVSPAPGFAGPAIVNPSRQVVLYLSRAPPVIP